MERESLTQKPLALGTVPQGGGMDTSLVASCQSIDHYDLASSDQPAQSTVDKLEFGPAPLCRVGCWPAGTSMTA
jgi:hypothetical protein